MFKTLLIPTLSLVSCATAFAQTSRSTEPVIVQGVVDLVEGSPVRLSDPGYRFMELDSKPKKLQIIGDIVTVENTSGRAIRRLYLKFMHVHGDPCCGGAGGNITAVDNLAVGESPLVDKSNITMTWFAQSNDMRLTVVPTGAEFEDRSHWAAPRTVKYPMYNGALSLPGSHLIIRRFSWLNDGYEAVLEMGQPKVVAYRLGVVKDTPSSFEVRLGKWIELTPEDGSRFTDRAVSLSPDQLFAREGYSALILGKEVTNPGGVAIFVAALRFADGRVWQQDTSRDALLWNN